MHWSVNITQTARLTSTRIERLELIGTEWDGAKHSSGLEGSGDNTRVAGLKGIRSAETRRPKAGGHLGLDEFLERDQDRALFDLPRKGASHG